VNIARAVLANLLRRGGFEGAAEIIRKAVNIPLSPDHIQCLKASLESVEAKDRLRGQPYFSPKGQLCYVPKLTSEEEQAKSGRFHLQTKLCNFCLASFTSSCPNCNDKVASSDHGSQQSSQMSVIYAPMDPKADV